VCRARHREQGLKAGLIDAAAGRGAAGMVDHHAHAAGFDHRPQRDELVVLHLQRQQHVELGQRAQQRRGVRVIARAHHRRIEGDADHTRGTQTKQRVVPGVVAHDRNALEAPLPARKRIEQAAVVEAIARVRADEQRVADAIRVHHRQVLLQRRDLLTRRAVGHVGRVRKARRVEHMAMRVDLRFVEDAHASCCSSWCSTW
jgi:hypothetical protein